MNKRIPQLVALVAIAASVLSGVPAYAAMSYADADKIAQACEANFKPDQLAPAAAKDCSDKLNADNYAVLEALKASGPAGEERARALLKNANAILDMRSMYESLGAPETLRTGMASRISANTASLLSKSPSSKAKNPLVALGYYVDVKLSQAWVVKYMPAQEGTFKKAVYDYAVMEKARKDYLTAKGVTQAAWDGKKLPERLAEMTAFADSMADQCMSVPVTAVDEALFKKMVTVYQVLGQEMSEPKLNAFVKYLLSVRDNLAAQKASGKKAATAVTPEAKAQVSKMSKKLDGMKEMSLGDKSAALGAMFDLSSSRGGVVDMSEGSKTASAATAAKSASSGLTAEQCAAIASRVQDRLPAEIKGTKAGDAILQFYEDPAYKKAGTNTMKLIIQTAPGAVGYWDGKAITFSKEFTESWMAEHGYTAEDLMKKDGPLLELTRYVAPNFVHEATHQRQSAWAIANKVYQPYQQDLEVEAFSMGGLFVIEKAKMEAAAGNENYGSQILEAHLQRAISLKKDGLVGITREVAPLYQKQPTFEGFSADAFSVASMISDELAARKKQKAEHPFVFAAQEKLRQGIDPNNGSLMGTVAQRMSADDIKGLNTPTLEALMNSPFKWYQAYGDKKASDQQWIVETRKAILESSSTAKTVPPLPGK